MVFGHSAQKHSEVVVHASVIIIITYVFNYILDVELFIQIPIFAGLVCFSKIIWNWYSVKSIDEKNSIRNLAIALYGISIGGSMMMLSLLGRVTDNVVAFFWENVVFGLLISALIGSVALVAGLFLTQSSERKIMNKIDLIEGKLGKLDNMEFILLKILNRMEKANGGKPTTLGDIHKELVSSCNNQDSKPEGG